MSDRSHPAGVASSEASALRTSVGTSRELVFVAPWTVQLREAPVSPPGPGEVALWSVESGISAGTELAWLRGEASALHKHWDQRFRLFTNDGIARGYPVTPGYETVAQVAQLGEGVEQLALGDLAYLDRPHRQHHVVSAGEAAWGRLPSGMSATRGIFLPLTRVALGGVHDANLALGDRVVVMGLGTVGLLATQLALRAGAEMVVGVDLVRRRLDAAAAFGAVVVDPAIGDVARQVRDLTGPAGADVAIEASGSYQGLHQAIRCCGVGGRVVTISTYRGQARDLALGEEYQRNAITLRSSMTLGCPHREAPRWDRDRLDQTARALLASGALAVDQLVTHRIPFEEAPSAYRLLATAPGTEIKVTLTYARP